ncbi:MAG: Hsp20/alpha crystallin family protein [Candidatus Aenigmarchaeota archaeon]|nr:Hsp20/alpha crystallin family protein [Candidatus Aenigmarchaeota archaeon]
MRKKTNPFRFFWEDDPWGRWDRTMRDFGREIFNMGSGIAVDISETDDDVIVKADLPGIEKKNVSLRIVDSALIIEAEQSEELREEEENFFRQERSYGKFYREVPLPVEVEEDNASAEMKDGVLTVKLPKKEKSKKKGKEIKIN